MNFLKTYLKIVLMAFLLLMSCSVLANEGACQQVFKENKQKKGGISDTELFAGSAGLLLPTGLAFLGIHWIIDPMYSDPLFLKPIGLVFSGLGGISGAYSIYSNIRDARIEKEERDLED